MTQLKKVRQQIDDEMMKNGEKLCRLEVERKSALVEMGNLVHESVPVSDDEVGVLLEPFITVQYNKVQQLDIVSVALPH